MKHEKSVIEHNKKKFQFYELAEPKIWGGAVMLRDRWDLNLGESFKSLNKQIAEGYSKDFENLSPEEKRKTVDFLGIEKFNRCQKYEIIKNITDKDFEEDVLDWIEYAGFDSQRWFCCFTHYLITASRPWDNNLKYIPKQQKEEEEPSEQDWDDLILWLFRLAEEGRRDYYKSKDDGDDKLEADRSGTWKIISEKLHPDLLDDSKEKEAKAITDKYKKRNSRFRKKHDLSPRNKESNKNNYWEDFVKNEFNGNIRRNLSFPFEEGSL